MKKYILLLIGLFVFIPQVKAYYNDEFGTYISENGRFFSLNSYPGLNDKGYVLHNYNNLYSASPNENYLLGNNGGLLMQCGVPMIANSNYSITYYFKYPNGMAYPHWGYSNWEKRIILSNSASSRYFKSYLKENGGSTDVWENCSLDDWCVGAFTMIFKADIDASCVGMAFSGSNHSTYMNNYEFLGYTYENLGTSSLTQSDINNALNSQFDNINLKIDNINSALENSTNSINNNIDDLKQKQDETNDYLKDDTAPDVDISSLGNVQGLLPPGPVDSLLNIPFQFLSILNSSFGGVCVPITGTFAFDMPLTFPCFDEILWNNMPAILMPFINIIPAVFILIKYLKHLYKKVDRATSLESNSDDEWGVI